LQLQLQLQPQPQSQLELQPHPQLQPRAQPQLQLGQIARQQCQRRRQPATSTCTERRVGIVQRQVVVETEVSELLCHHSVTMMEIYAHLSQNVLAWVSAFEA